jgi:hypothetical protein
VVELQDAEDLKETQADRLAVIISSRYLVKKVFYLPTGHEDERVVSLAPRCH